MRLSKMHQSLFDQAVSKIKDLLPVKGVEGKFNGRTVLRVPDEQMFNLDGGRYLVEISATELIDNEGYSYYLSTLTLEQLCDVVDAISEEEDEDGSIVGLTEAERSGLTQIIAYTIQKRNTNKASDLSYTELLNLKNKFFQ